MTPNGNELHSMNLPVICKPLTNFQSLQVKEITLLETKVNKLERENKQLQTKWTEAKDIADKIDDFSNERERIKSELEAVRKENEELHIIKGLFCLGIQV